MRGWWINLLNVVRAWLEKRIVLSILRIEAKRAGLSPLEIRQTMREAKRDSNFSPEFVKPAAAVATRQLLRDKFPALYKSAEEKAERRYKEGRVNHEPKDNHMRPFEEGMGITFAREAQKHDRSARYVGGRSRRIIFDYDDLGLAKEE